MTNPNRRFPVFNFQKIMKKYIKRVAKNAPVVTVLVLAATSSVAFAAGPATIADLWNTINMVDVTAAIFGIGALVIGVDLAQLGYMKVRRIVKGAH